MKYYMIFLMAGKVVDISSFDDEDVRDQMAEHYRKTTTFGTHQSQDKFDEVQTLNVVN